MTRFATALILSLVAPQLSLAATFTVTNLDDNGSGSLRAAMVAANQTPGPNQIIFDQALTGTLALASDLPIVHQSLSVVGPGAHRVTIDGSLTFRGFLTPDAGHSQLDLEIAHLTFTRMRHERFERGGNAVGAVARSVIVRDLVLVENGIYLNDNSAIHLVADEVVVERVVGIANLGINAVIQVRDSGTVELHDLTLTDNRTDYFSALAVYQSSSIHASQLTITDNQSDDRGTVLLSADGALVVSDAEIHRNTTMGDFIAYAAGAYLRGDTILTQRLSVTNNTALGRAKYGSGLTVGGRDVIIRNSTVSTNQGGRGGIELQFSDDDQLVRLEYMTIVDNTSTHDGGGINKDTPWGNALVAASVAYGNFFNGITSDIRDPFGHLPIIVDASVVGSFGPQPILEPNPGTNLLGVDPALQPLRRHAGSVVHIPQRDSPLVDWIDALSPTCTAFPDDQRMLPRPAQLGCDAGAAELQAPLFADGLELP